MNARAIATLALLEANASTVEVIEGGYRATADCRPYAAIEIYHEGRNAKLLLIERGRFVAFVYDDGLIAEAEAPGLAAATIVSFNRILVARNHRPDVTERLRDLMARVAPVGVAA